MQIIVSIKQATKDTEDFKLVGATVNGGNGNGKGSSKLPVVKITGRQNYHSSAIENGGNYFMVVGHNVKMPDLPNLILLTHYGQVHLEINNTHCLSL